MDTLNGLRSKIAEFPGYSSQTDRRRSEELVRAYLGEALVELERRTDPLPSTTRATLDSLVLRTAFVNLSVFRAFENEPVDDVAVDRVASSDLGTVALADRVADIDPALLDVFLEEAHRLLDDRDATMLQAGRRLSPE